MHFSFQVDLSVVFFLIFFSREVARNVDHSHDYCVTKNNEILNVSMETEKPKCDRKLRR